MKKMTLLAMAVVVIFGLAGCVMRVPGGIVRTETEIEVEVEGGSIEAPPPIVLPAPPAVVVIPGTYAYFAPDVSVDLFFYGGYWYRPWGGFWFRADTWNGSWIFFSTPPTIFLSLPVDYRVIFVGYSRIHYGEFHNNWYRWEREHHWDRDSHWNQHRDAIRQMPRHQLEQPRRDRQQNPQQRYAPPPRQQQQRQAPQRNKRG